MPKNAGEPIAGTQRQGGKESFFRIAISNRSLKEQKEREKKP